MVQVVKNTILNEFMFLSEWINLLLNFRHRGVNNIMWKCVPMAKSVAKE